MQPNYHVVLPEQLYQRLQTIARSHGQTIEKLVQETLEEVIDEEEEPSTINAVIKLQSLPFLDVVLPPPGSSEEEILRHELAQALSKGPSLSQMIIDDRGER